VGRFSVCPPDDRKETDVARPDKAAAVAELTDAFRDSSAAVLTEYRGLTVAQLKELRRSLAPNATYAVVKNTLTKIAAREAGVDAFESLLEGPSAIAFVKGDPVEVAKSLRDFGRTNPLLVIKGGLLEGRAISAEDVRKLADLESREVLLSKLAGAMLASLTKAVSTFAAPLSQMARLLGALEAQGGAGTATEEAPAAEAAAEEAPAEAEAPAAEAPSAETPTDETPADAEPAPVTDDNEAPAEADAATGETSTSEATEQE
jgi:large subunit ribosomal protein L10